MTIFKTFYSPSSTPSLPPDPGWEGEILVVTILGRGFCDAANTEKSRGAHKKSLFAWLPFHAALESAFK